MRGESLPSCPVSAQPADTSFALTARRHRAEGELSCPDVVAEEVPVALVFNGVSHAVMMATPADLEHFALGFALSEGIVGSPREVFDIEVEPHVDGIEVKLEIAQPAFLALKQHRRTLTGRTGCGVCGTESLQLLDLAPERVTTPMPAAPDVAAIQRILEALPAQQPLMRATGCAHAAAWCSVQGEVLCVFEDVGRHNAMDKLLGWLAREAVDTRTGFVFLTSRASYELVRKAARRNLPMLATISAPTALAIRLAQEAGIELLSFCRPSGFVSYPA